MSYLIDTNVLSELTKPRANAGVTAWMDRVPNQDVRLSVMVIGEIWKGIVKDARRDPKKAAQRLAWLEELEGSHSEQIIPVTREVAVTFGEMSARDPLPCVDGLLAATAKVYGWTVVTRNVSDFERTGVDILNPFEPPSPN